MTDLIGPGAFGAANSTTTRPAVTPGNAGGDPDTFFKDCTSQTARDGTEVLAAFLNFMLVQARRMVRGSAVVENNTDDNMLLRALRSQRSNWLTPGGTANNITLTPDPAFTDLAHLVGVPLRFIATGANSGVVTLNVSALGAKDVVWASDATALAANDILVGAPVEVIYDGTKFRMRTAMSPSQSRSVAAPATRFTDSTPGTRNFTPTETGLYQIELAAAGGGGGGGVGTGGGGGGAGGGRLMDFVTLTAGVAYSYTIATGGAAGSAGFNGTAGGNSTFAAPGGTLTATGGGAGVGANTGGGGTGGSAGSGSGFSTRGYADPAQSGFQGSPQISQGGQGGSSPAGGFGGQASFGAGNAGSAPGGGGSGGTGGNSGGAGANGRIVITRWGV